MKFRSSRKNGGLSNAGFFAKYACRAGIDFAKLFGLVFILKFWTNFRQKTTPII
jgi:hypothetical protein